MKVFIDANIIVSVLNKEYPLFSHTTRLLSLADHRKFQLFTSPVCLAIAFYFAEKKSGNAVAKRKITLIVEKLGIAVHEKEDVLLALNNKSINDFEDGLEYHAALNAECECIVTENVDDFYFSEIEVLDTKDFLLRHVIKNN